MSNSGEVFSDDVQIPGPLGAFTQRKCTVIGCSSFVFVLPRVPRCK